MTGKGCVGCEVTVGGECGTDEQPCKYHQFKCYKRPCCVTHDKCLDKAKDIWEELRCHREAQDNGCDYEDAKGTTHGKADATCFNPARQCIKVPKQACCIGVECADMTVEDCEAMGGIAQGEETVCRSEIPNEDDFEPLPIPEEAVEVPVTCTPGR